MRGTKAKSAKTPKGGTTKTRRGRPNDEVCMDIIAFHLRENSSYYRTAKEFNMHPQAVARICENEELVRKFWDRTADAKIERAKALNDDTGDTSLKVIYEDTLLELSRRLTNKELREEITTKELTSLFKALHPILHPIGNIDPMQNEKDPAEKTKTYFMQFNTTVHHER